MNAPTRAAPSKGLALGALRRTGEDEVAGARGEEEEEEEERAAAALLAAPWEPRADRYTRRLGRIPMLLLS